MTLRSQGEEHERPLAANSLRPALQATITFSIALQHKLGRHTASGSGSLVATLSLHATARDCTRLRTHAGLVAAEQHLQQLQQH